MSAIPFLTPTHLYKTISPRPVPGSCLSAIPIPPSLSSFPFLPHLYDDPSGDEVQISLCPSACLSVWLSVSALALACGEKRRPSNSPPQTYPQIMSQLLTPLTRKQTGHSHHLHVLWGVGYHYAAIIHPPRVIELSRQGRQMRRGERDEIKITFPLSIPLIIVGYGNTQLVQDDDYQRPTLPVTFRLRNF